jgi:hypothetical protein
MENRMKIDPDNIEEVKELLEYALDSRSWPSVEEALYIIKEELGYEVEEDDEEDEE